ncbi:ATP-dependent RNA helicase eIF4A [Penicillium argentinense]|uniref:RNA helicase n=1 Tax=Penicillium argentinense TaxID=1131581 RepID=A0A9W9G4S3_9EURO|nr:ATP-dependent RNA helicase eIF4A [Penicillium argentinense]KAJ5112024.1 ATP-dependent RNA helicase eIF4A [Penicillium argentinense]
MEHISQHLAVWAADVSPNDDGLAVLGLRTDIVGSLRAYGLETPSALQKTASRLISNHRDLYVEAPSGQDRSETLVINLLRHIDTTSPTTQAIVLVFTDQLARELDTLVRAMGRQLAIKCHCCGSEDDPASDEKALVSGTAIVIGTAERLAHLCADGYLNKDGLKLLVLDDADDVLDTSMEHFLDIFHSVRGPHFQICLYYWDLSFQFQDWTFRRLVNSPVQIYGNLPV